MTPNRVMNPTEMTSRGDFRAINADIHTLMLSSHTADSPPGTPCWGAGVWWQGTKHWEYPWVLTDGGLGIVPRSGRATSRVLDVGSGGSVFPCYLAHLGFSVVALELGGTPQVGLYQRFREAGLLVTVVHDITAPPILPLESFDWITCVCVLEHIEDHQAALCRMRGYLKAQGRMAMTIEFGPAPDEKGPTHRFNRDTVPEFLEATGWRVVGAIDMAPPRPWGEYLGRIPAEFPDSAPVGVLSLLLQRHG